MFYRFILNYKRLPYRTVWVEFHDVERAFRAINAPPTATARDGRPVYTLPALVDPSRSPSNPVILTNPNMIAEYLEVSALLLSHTLPGWDLVLTMPALLPTGHLPGSPRLPAGLEGTAVRLRAILDGRCTPAASPDHGAAHVLPPTRARTQLLPRRSIYTLWSPARAGLGSCETALRPICLDAREEQFGRRRRSRVHGPRVVICRFCPGLRAYVDQPRLAGRRLDPSLPVERWAVG